jgi:uncharacterized protein YndB with AHSA1/START domain
MPAVQRTRTIFASCEELWDVLGDPHHLPRWWPRVSRVEAVTLSDTSDGQPAEEADAFTEVLTGSSGKIVRADFTLLVRERPRRIVWSQEVEGTPFARVLKSAETEITLTGIPPEGRASAGQLADAPGGLPSGDLLSGDLLSGGLTFDASGGDTSATQVTIELRQELQGFRGESALSLRMAGISRFGSPLVRRAAASTIDDALDGLERIVGRAD